mmetsp:Transcript_70658/g.228857  ORF Transcript_70658/g.228857 Transcript_70658/m.228857 type:complete len:239 (+) Transcript_70658:273-989(+)
MRSVPGMWCQQPALTWRRLAAISPTPSSSSRRSPWRAWQSSCLTLLMQRSCSRSTCSRYPACAPRSSSMRTSSIRNGTRHMAREARTGLGRWRTAGLVAACRTSALQAGLASPSTSAPTTSSRSAMGIGATPTTARSPSPSHPSCRRGSGLATRHTATRGTRRCTCRHPSSTAGTRTTPAWPSTPRFASLCKWSCSAACGATPCGRSARRPAVRTAKWTRTLTIPSSCGCSSRTARIQ